jgi:hypothetical protein
MGTFQKVDAAIGERTTVISGTSVSFTVYLLGLGLVRSGPWRSIHTEER